jgi:hypothetical protein
MRRLFKRLITLLGYVGFLEQMKKDTSETITKIRSNTDAAEN